MDVKPQSENKVNVCTSIVAKDLCIGCGVCAGTCPAGNLKMGWNSFGQLVPADQEKCLPNCRRCLDVCPFHDHEENEDTLAATQFGSIEGIQHTPETGYYLGAFVGHANGGYRDSGASGGLASWFLSSLLEQDLADYVICVGANPDPNRLFTYQVYDNPEDVRRAAKSKYYPVEISEAVTRILQRDGRYAIVGLPCTLKALRLAANAVPRLKARIVCLSGLVCGQNKTRSYTDYLIAKAGANKSQVTAVDFRGKRAAPPAQLIFRVSEGKDGTTRELGWAEACRDVWVSGMFTPRSCLFCDDIFAETADIAFMDAWLPEYKANTSIALVRSRSALKVILAARNDGAVSLQPIAIDRVIASQAGVIEEKRMLLSYRLAIAASCGTPPPRKRVPARRPNLLVRELLRAREALRLESHRAWQEHGADAGAFEKSISHRRKQYAHTIRLVRLLQRGYRFARSPLKVLVKKIMLKLGKGTSHAS